MCESKNKIKDSFNILLENGVKKEDIFYEGELHVYRIKNLVSFQPLS